MVDSGRGLVPFLRRRTWWVVLALLWISGMTLALAFRTEESHGLATARGVVDGSFHPIAGRFTPDATTLPDCHSGDARCLEQAFGNLAYTEGPQAALALFDRRQASDRAVAADCHRIAHMIGSAALAHYHGNVALTYSRGSATCASGYYHGILERAFAGVNSRRGLVRAARALCRGAAVRRHSFLDYQCTHGLGHGLMIQTGYDLPTALAVCRRLQSRWDEVSCTGGVFMENGTTVYGMRSRWLKVSDPIYPCNHLGMRYKASCYLRVTTQILLVNHSDWQDTAARCSRLLERWRAYCFRSYGRDAVTYAGGKPPSIRRLCSLAGSGQGQCLYGAARTLADRDAGTQNAAALCRGVAAHNSNACFAGLGVVIGLLQPTPRARLTTCEKAAGGYAPACARAAADEVAPNGGGAWG